MAGGTATGAAAADASLFRGRPVVLTPAPDTDVGALSLVRSLWDGVGARVIEMDADLHDRVVAASSHLPQLLAFALASSASRNDAVTSVEEVAGAGFRDMTRLAASDAEMWKSIAQANREAILEAIDAFDVVWRELRAAVEAGDEAGLEKLMREAAALKKRMDNR